MSVAAMPPRPLWRRLLLPVLLGVSATLNLAFVAGFFVARAHHRDLALGGPPERMMQHGPPPADRVAARVSREIGLNDAQRAAFQTFLESVRHDGEHLRGRTREHVRRAWDELAKRAPDEATIAQSFEAGVNEHRKFQTEAARNLRVFLATLDDDTRTRFVAWAKERPFAPLGLAPSR